MNGVMTKTTAAPTIAKEGGLNLPFRYFWAASGSFLLLMALLPIAAASLDSGVLHPRFLALAHLAVLGWATMVAMGALFQLVPVVLEVTLWSDLLGRWQFWFYTIGVLGLAGSFWHGRLGDGVPFFGLLVAVGIVLFLINVAFTLARVKKIDMTGIHILAAFLWFTLTALSGLALAVNFRTGFLSEAVLATLRGHLYLGLWGWLSLLIIGVSYKLFPMFTLAHGYSLRAAKVAFSLGNMGLLGLLLGDWVLGSPPAWNRAASLLIVLAVFSYGKQVIAMSRARLRPFGVPMKYALTAVFYLHVAALLGVLRMLGLGASSEGFDFGLGALVILGWISLSIVGYLYKIFPHLVWLKKYGDKVGLEPVPAMDSMVDERLPRAGFFLFNAGIPALTLGFMLLNPVLVRLAGLVLLAAVGVLAVAMTQARRA
ncbi:MAG: hypothetical protein HYY65_12925 [Candidatus Tectomicrobia bacterium]|uniref:Uncharacterized protein n=1 Tax=Tectimicrobiota bacterium TaxID=2528274 RepID=A0A932GRA4_UNCTE|nr:hypothetical protein [Candidatus Tectomicrobia bacterium]